ncbi:zinc finger protein 184 [Synchiropus splendidus]|uniref:zinc finger protein 184 n=1 Tax=Synchiropus splendidus TaxID=270530 RepID=UPI00237E705B|nr:zinc finger protein 184 [Synchiropus splendidus]
MSSEIQAQVESLLSSLIKVAAVELTKLFERSLRAAVVESREDDPQKKRSIGVQVEPSLPGSLPVCLGDTKEADLEDVLFSDEHADMKCSPLIEQVLAESVVLRFLESAADYDSLTHTAIQDSQELTPEDLQVSPMNHKLLWLEPESSDSERFVNPLIPKTEPLDALEEPLLACVSTVNGVAYSPSTLDGAATLPVPETTETKSDKMLLRPCVVELVDILKVPNVSAELPEDSSVPKDLRRHKGHHTGRRICCFTPCGRDVWRLRLHTCNTCGKVFGRRKILRRHLRFHAGEKPYVCSRCPKTFTLKKSLHRHQRFHTGERPHICPHCGKGFHLRENLKAHLRFHMGKKPYSCDRCGHTFRVMKNLDKHKLSQCGFFVPSFKTLAGL